MFERNVVDRGTDSNRKTFAVRITFGVGQVASGVCYVVATRSLDEELNQPGRFLDFEPYNGERSFIAKSSIAQIARIDLPRADQLNRAAHFHDSADPYAILGIQRGSDATTIQAAYHTMAKRYHPDRFAGLDIPQEMGSYVSDMARRVNEAYSMLVVAEKQDTERSTVAAGGVQPSAYEQFRSQAAARYT